MSAVVRGLLVGLAREVGRELNCPSGERQCAHAAWMIANAGFGLDYSEIAKAEGLTRQSVHEAVAKIVDRCDDRNFERPLQRVAESFGVRL